MGNSLHIIDLVLLETIVINFVQYLLWNEDTVNYAWLLQHSVVILAIYTRLRNKASMDTYYSAMTS